VHELVEKGQTTECVTCVNDTEQKGAGANVRELQSTSDQLQKRRKKNQKLVNSWGGFFVGIKDTPRKVKGGRDVIQCRVTQKKGEGPK